MRTRRPPTTVLICLVICGYFVWFSSHDFDRFKLLVRTQTNDSHNDKNLLLPPDFVLNKMTRLNRGKLFLRYINRIQTFCPDIMRVGNQGDGGKEVCMISQHKPKAPCLVYSFGINWKFEFDRDINAQCGCEVHCFDPSMNMTDQKINTSIWFHNVGLDNQTYVNERGWQMKPLNKIRKELHHENRKIDILKMDIEGHEWRSLSHLITSGAFHDVGQLLVEYHTTGLRIEHLSVLRELHNAGFRSFMRERNFGCRKIVCIEVSYVRDRTQNMH